MVAKKITTADLQSYVDAHYTPAMVARETGLDLSNLAKRMKPLRPRELPHTVEPKNAKGYVITSAQNGAPIHRKFFETLQAYCKRHSYNLVVIPVRYRNPTAPKEAENAKNDTWASEVMPYLCSHDVDLCNGLKLMGSVPIQPTAARPLSGLDTITGEGSGIFAHPKVAFNCIATKQGKLPKLLYTTGAVTRPRYSKSKAGRKGEFHHSISAVVVQREGDLFHMRHLHAQADGSFYDLDCKYSGKRATKGQKAATLTPGDIHAAEICPKTLDAICRVAKRLKPRKIVLHDVLDFGSASHHNTFFDRFRKRQESRDEIHAELLETAAIVDQIAALTPMLAIVSSNHNDHFTQWLQSDKNANDLANAWVYAETRAYYLRELMEKREPVSPFEFWARRMCKKQDRIKFLGRNDSLSVLGVEHSFHGDKGPGGARGSTMNLSKIGAKVTKGHSHSPGIIDGCYDAGTSSRLDLEYTAGSPSAWINSMVVLYPNGKRTHVHVIDGRCGI